MIRVLVFLILAINRLCPVPVNLREIDRAKASVHSYQEWEQEELTRLLPEFGAAFDLAEKTVLDIGCGLGGKTAQYAGMGAEAVFGLDLRLHSLTAARDFCAGQGLMHTGFVCTDAGKMALPNNSIDAIVSVNAFEHIDDLYDTLVECRRVIKPGGQIFLHFPPFYSPWGAHLEGWVNFPWPHVVFPDKALLQAAATVEAQRQRNDTFIPTAQVNWAAHERLPELNRVTAYDFFHLVEVAELEVAHVRMLPLGRHYFLRRGLPGRVMLALLNMSVQLPLLREVITTKMVIRLTKPA